jgi:ribokinase
MTRNSVLVIGSSNTDMVIKMERIPKPGETILGGEFVTAQGGKGANQAVAAARAGGDVTFIARLGQDMLGNQAFASLRAAGINLKYVLRDPASPSGVALVLVSKTGENSIAVASGANSKLAPADIRGARRAFQKATVLLLQLETPLRTVETAASIATAAGLRIILNPAPARPLPEKLLRRLYLVTPNESEAELLSGVAIKDKGSAAKAARVLRGRGVRNVIITMGNRGAFVAGEEGTGLISAHKVKPVDTTAAGDVFNGALAVALADGKSLLDAARFASAAAAISVTRLGAQTSTPTGAEIARFLARGDTR